MRFLSNPTFSLFCSGFNAFFAVSSFMEGDGPWGVVFAIFAAVCFRNYLKHR